MRGADVGRVPTTKKRPSHHKYKSSKQFELKQSWKALRALNARWPPPVYPVFEDENSNGSDEKLVKRKIAYKKTDRTNITATNFVWEQLSSLEYFEKAPHTIKQTLLTEQNFAHVFSIVLYLYLFLSLSHSRIGDMNRKPFASFFCSIVFSNLTKTLFSLSSHFKYTPT